MSKTLNSLFAAIVVAVLQWAPSQVFAGETSPLGILGIATGQSPLICAIDAHHLAALELSPYAQLRGGDYGV